MIDTVIISIPQNEYKPRSNYRGTFSWKPVGKNSFFEKYLLSSATPTSGYFPKVFLHKNGRSESLRLEFSAPKVLHGNNLEEMSQKDFYEMIKKLQLLIFRMGLYLSKEVLSRSNVCAIHIGKNIRLSGGYTSSFVIKELSKLNISKRFDLNKTDFRNSGEGFQVYTKQHSIVFYDKSLEILSDEKIAKDLTQKGLFRQKTDQILRLEIRLCKAQKIKGVYGVLGLKYEEFLYQNCQDCNLSEILKYYWKTIIFCKNEFLFTKSVCPETNLAFLLRKLPDLKPKEAIYLIGLQSIAVSENSMREIRHLFDRKFSQRNWYRITADIKKLNSLNKFETHEWVRQIEDQLGIIRINSP